MVYILSDNQSRLNCMTDKTMHSSPGNGMRYAPFGMETLRESPPKTPREPVGTGEKYRAFNVSLPIPRSLGHHHAAEPAGMAID